MSSLPPVRVAFGANGWALPAPSVQLEIPRSNWCETPRREECWGDLLPPGSRGAPSAGLCLVGKSTYEHFPPTLRSSPGGLRVRTPHTRTRTHAHTHARAHPSASSPLTGCCRGGSSAGGGGRASGLWGLQLAGGQRPSQTRRHDCEQRPSPSSPPPAPPLSILKSGATFPLWGQMSLQLWPERLRARPTGGVSSWHRCPRSRWLNSTFSLLLPAWRDAGLAEGVRGERGGFLLPLPVSDFILIWKCPLRVALPCPPHAQAVQSGEPSQAPSRLLGGAGEGGGLACAPVRAALRPRVVACALHGGHVAAVPHAAAAQLAQVVQAAGDPGPQAELVQQTPRLQREGAVRGREPLCLQADRVPGSGPGPASAPSHPAGSGPGPARRRTRRFPEASSRPAPDRKVAGAAQGPAAP